MTAYIRLPIEAADAAPHAPESPAAEFPARRALASSALWLLGSNLWYSGCQWATVVALAKLGAPNALGHFGLALAVVTPIVVVSSMALRSFQATDVLQNYAFAEYLNLRLAANVVAGAVIGAAVAAGAVHDAAAAILIPLGVAKLAEATSETCYGLAQRHDRMRFVALSKATRGVLGLAALVAVVALGGTLAEGTWALAAAWTVFLLGVDLPASRALERVLARPDATRLWMLARECAPLGMLSGLVAVTQSVPRYLLQASHGAAAVGYFTALAGVGPALAHLAASVGHAAAPRLGWNAAGDIRRYRALVMRLLGAAALTSAVLTAGAVLGGRQFLTLAYTEEYAAYHTTFVLLVLAAGFWVVNTMAYFALLAVRRLGLLLTIQGFGFLATAVTGAWWVPRFGVDGAAAAVAFGGAAMAAINTAVLMRARGAR